ncbi:NAD(P)-dependent dehydrogenase (short-subunit alcohol dehydrogenase family) [Sphingomonas vulcanisoli]|uniref:NAD(P)-dependent dehydrogenase (Short-subunit alcohol dehydrogenase family) n=2 Tax=Sphingomonas vulcanisoli TaxID=1658060 RepID=A0ABX0TUM9_9SPHN|nr:NAD(P)-dependent dehydrogenase (short-subunit alcohol dehydrogenase family) [Sphingomonas vulcanisoli]
MKLAHKVAIVTGAGRNIGEEVAVLLASEGAQIAVVDLNEASAEAVVSRIAQAGGVARSYVCDVSDEAAVNALMDSVVGDFGGLDILINNVAISDNKSVLDLEKAEWDKVMAVTLTAPFLTSKAAAKAMIAGERSGRIVNVTSTSGYFGRARALAYTTAKGGLVNFTRSLAIQLAPHNIRVNSVVPNKIGSPVGKDAFNPDRKVVNLRNRPGEPIDLARAVLFLVSDDSDFIAGTEIFVDGGCSVMMAGE